MSVVALRDGLIHAKWLNSVACLPVGAYNTLVLSFVAFLCVWAGESVRSLIQYHRIQQRIIWQGGAALCLRGMAAYTPDFKRLKRTHLSQILRLRKSLPAIIMPRIVVSFNCLPLPPIKERTIRFELQVRKMIVSGDRLRAAVFGGVPLPTLANYVQFLLSTIRRDFVDSERPSTSSQRSSSTHNWGHWARDAPSLETNPKLDKLKPLILREEEDVVSARILWDLFLAEQDPSVLTPRKYFAGPDMVVPLKKSSSLELQLPSGYIAWLNERLGSSPSLSALESCQSYLLLYFAEQPHQQHYTVIDDSYQHLRSSHAFGVPAGRTSAILVKLIPQQNSEVFYGFTVGRPIFYTDFILTGESPNRLLDPDHYYATYRKFAQNSSVSPEVAPRHNDDEIPDQALISIAMDGSNPNNSPPDHLIATTVEARHTLTTMWRALSRMVGVSILRASRSTTTHRGDLFTSSPIPIPPSPSTLQVMFTAGLRERDIYGLDNEGEMDCLICMSEKKQTILLPCGHSSCCVECLKSLRKEKCPVCRGNFTASVIIPIMR